MKKVSPKITMSVMYFLFYVGVGAYFPFYMDYLESVLHMSPGDIGTVASLGPLLAVGFVPLTGMLTDKIKSPKIGVVAIFLLSGFVTFMIGFSKNLAMVGFFVVMQGMVRSPVNPTLDNFAVNIPEKYGVDYGKTKRYGAIGRSISGTIAGFLIANVAPNAFIYLFAFLFWISAVLLMITPCKSGDEITSGDNKKDKEPYFKQVFQLVKRKDYLYMVLLFAGYFSLGDSFNVYLKTNLIALGAVTEIIGFITVFIALPEFVVLPLIEKLTDKMNFEKMMYFILGMQLLRFGTYYFTQNTWLFLGITVLNSFAICASSILFVQFTKRKIPGTLSATGLSLATTVRALCTSFIMKICGNLYAGSGKIQNVYIVAIGMALVMVLATFVYFRKGTNPLAVDNKSGELGDTNTANNLASVPQESKK